MARLIDNEPNTRVKPMKILCMGMARTGTNCDHCPRSPQTGLQPLSWLRMFQEPPRDFNPWIEAMEYNFFNTKGTPRYGPEKFDRLMGSFDACLDVPTCLFWEDLVEAYPNAKVILTTRDPDSWLKSANATVFKFMQTPFFRFWHYMDSTALGPLFRKSEMVWKIFWNNNYDEAVLKQAYLDRNERIRQTVSKDRLLEFETRKDGWDKVCQFLDLPVPDEPWPRTYPTEAFQTHMDHMDREMNN
ncbi:P-loop containing nucleoside triphosphate hydrolase protein [Aspergillus tamarii]|uniref:P-loop containing nucleoside triphosphate hydrolase protein n=1 Tax=Aspergillus tamarii TaxID=41984 RepID=A0A5N6V109_ASPTM|nr:P-loop containing nucleoside triphosphate hydrolase protein [Aspergillus tamarii]